jgi:hypothetical protein
VHSADNDLAALYPYAADASSTTNLGTAQNPFILPRAKRHGVLTGFEIIPSAALSPTGGTNFRTIQVLKIDTTGTVSIASAPVVASFSTATQALVAGQPTQFTLNPNNVAGALNLLETDVLAFTSIASAAGASLPQAFLRGNLRVM